MVQAEEDGSRRSLGGVGEQFFDAGGHIEVLGRLQIDGWRARHGRITAGNAA